MIANLGANIKLGQVIRLSDITGIKSALDNELSRRSKAKSETITSVVGDKVIAENPKKVNTDTKTLTSTKSIKVEIGDIVFASSYGEEIEYLQKLMVENLKS